MSETILVVDDDREIVGAIALLLEAEGYHVLRAYDGMEALDKALDPALRLIIMDVMMPKLDGLSAVLRIRERRNLPILVLSAKSEDSDKVLGLSMGADAHRHGDQDRGPAHAESGAYLPRRGDLQPGLGAGNRLRPGEYGDGPHPPHPGEDRARSQGTRISKGGVGHWIQNGKKVGLSAALPASPWG